MVDMKKLGVVLVGIFLTLVIGGKLISAADGNTGGWFNPVGRNLTPTPTPTPKTIYSALLLGGGGAGHEGGELTDTMMLMVVNIASKSAVMVNIPRDIYIETHAKDGKTAKNKINFGYYLGGPDEVKRLVAEVTGVQADYYAWVDFGGFARLIDLLGGIDVDVPQSFVDELYPITGKEDDSCGKTPEEIKLITATYSGLMVDRQFPCRYERLEFKKGLTHMDGQTALKFVRSRHSAIGGGDFARAARQQAVILAVRNKLLSFGSVTRIGSLAAEADRSVSTDLDLGTGLKLAPQLSDWKTFDVKQIVLSTENVLRETTSSDRQYILLPKTSETDWATVRAYVASQFPFSVPQ